MYAIRMANAAAERALSIGRVAVPGSDRISAERGLPSPGRYRTYSQLGETMTQSRIEAWRLEIDALDEQLLLLFNKRARYAIEIGLIKRQLAFPIDVPEREAQIIARMVEINEGPLDGDAVRRLFEASIAESRHAERAMLEG